ncbi:DUF1203 domain-containing protein [Mesorhizobium sp. BAC0120]|uniref:DUF1203 domain-containing protein n=1 Tax=Mesorhizobium sp. BAC0120 TaxID=3090670 RepID=UPI00298C8144|nr:DUF1203 domain-containing protein [Mesorhizobium sp. BAC0120]MDW6020207.1 DUF1203 domain-containing protein [Mesorhizobium sp. BAC0120]
MTIRFTALPTQDVRALQLGGPDAYGFTPERRISDGDGVPCRHCLKDIAEGEGYLILAYRPFPALQPYAETGPIFLHAKECERAEEGEELPEMLTSVDYIVRGYDRDNRIVYGTGAVVPTQAIISRAEALLERDDIAYVHVRSARNNCYQCRIERDQTPPAKL